MCVRTTRTLSILRRFEYFFELCLQKPCITFLPITKKHLMPIQICDSMADT